jgi:hypothetical protein
LASEAFQIEAGEEFVADFDAHVESRPIEERVPCPKRIGIGALVNAISLVQSIQVRRDPVREQFLSIERDIEQVAGATVGLSDPQVLRSTWHGLQKPVSAVCGKLGVIRPHRRTSADKL